MQALQRAGHVTGVTGDGVNGVPALRQAELGVAVASATDVAKAAAGVVLTEPGRDGVLTVVRTGREVHRRMLTYTLNKTLKTLETVVFLSLGLWLTGRFVISSTLIVLLLFTNDFVTMSSAADRVSLLLVFTSQACVYVLRTDGRLWPFAPGRWMALASFGDVVVVSLSAVLGWLMAPLPAALVATLLAAAIVFAPVLDQAKRFVFPRFAIV